MPLVQGSFALVDLLGMNVTPEGITVFSNGKY